MCRAYSRHGRVCGDLRCKFIQQRMAPRQQTRRRNNAPLYNNETHEAWQQRTSVTWAINSNLSIAAKVAARRRHSAKKAYRCVKQTMGGVRRWAAA